MIPYAPFDKTLLDNRLMKYSLTCKQGFSANTIHRMKHGKAHQHKNYPVLDCKVSDHVTYESAIFFS